MKKVPDLAEEVEVDEKQLNLAMTLVDSLSTTFDKVDFKDRYRDALMELVEKKIDGKEVISVSDEEVKQAPVVDIMDALKASIEEAKLKKPA